jgi:hypothetical protein
MNLHMSMRSLAVTLAAAGGLAVVAPTAAFASSGHDSHAPGHAHVTSDRHAHGRGSGRMTHKDGHPKDDHRKDTHRKDSHHQDMRDRRDRDRGRTRPAHRSSDSVHHDARTARVARTVAGRTAFATASDASLVVKTGQSRTADHAVRHVTHHRSVSHRTGHRQALKRPLHIVRHGIVQHHRAIQQHRAVHRVVEQHKVVKRAASLHDRGVVNHRNAVVVQARGVALRHSSDDQPKGLQQPKGSLTIEQVQHQLQLTVADQTVQVVGQAVAD